MKLGQRKNASKAEHEPVPRDAPVDATDDAGRDDPGARTSVHAATRRSALSERWYNAWIGAGGSILAAFIVTSGACHVADVFEPNFVQLDNVMFNMRHIVEIVDTPNGCDVIMSNSAGVVSGSEQYLPSHSLNFAGCRSLSRAIENHTVSGAGRVTAGELFVSGLAQAHFITTTGACPDEMAPVPLGLSKEASTGWCRGSVDFAYRLVEGPPWPESWKATGLIVSYARGSCPDGMLFHSYHDELLWCCFGLSTIGELHPGHVTE